MNKVALIIPLMMFACGAPEEHEHEHEHEHENEHEHGEHHHPAITELRFRAFAGGGAFSCDGSYTFGTNSAAFTPTGLSLTVASPVVIAEDGTEAPFTIDGTGELHFGCSGHAHTTLPGHAEGGHYQKLRFTLAALSVTSADSQVSLTPDLELTIDGFNPDRSDAFLTLDALFETSELPVSCTGECEALTARLPHVFSAGE